MVAETASPRWPASAVSPARRGEGRGAALDWQAPVEIPNPLQRSGVGFVCSLGRLRLPNRVLGPNACIEPLPIGLAVLVVRELAGSHCHYGEGPEYHIHAKGDRDHEVRVHELNVALARVGVSAAKTPFDRS